MRYIYGNRKKMRRQAALAVIAALSVSCAMPPVTVKGALAQPAGVLASQEVATPRAENELGRGNSVPGTPGSPVPDDPGLDTPDNAGADVPDNPGPDTPGNPGPVEPDWPGTEVQPGEDEKPDPCADGHKAKAGKLKPATGKQAGRTAGRYCSVCGKQLVQPQRIAKIDTKSLTFKKESFIYNGKAIQPKVTVMDKDGKTIPSKYYTVAYKNNDQVGKAKATVVFSGNYKGKVSKTFFINGWKIDGAYYYLDGKKAQNEFVKSFHKTYYVDGDGTRATGWIKTGGEYYFLKRTDGAQVKNATVDGIPLGKDGKAVKSGYNNEKVETMIRARAIMQEITAAADTKEQKLHKVFDWVLKHPYRQYRKLNDARQTPGWEMTFANDEFLRGCGCCVSEASAFAFLAHECGYEKVYICDDTGHAWTEIDGRVYDTLFAEAKHYDSYYGSSYEVAKLWAVNRTLI